MEKLAEAVQQARQRLEQGRVPNERALEHTVILPILEALGWDSRSIDELWPEYSVGSGRVDWALCDKGEPRLLLEEKAPDQNLSAHEQQLLQYAFEQGIGLALLTNGKDWWFYLPLEEGEWAARRFATMDLAQQDISEISESFSRFLNKQAVCSGKARDEAKEMYDRKKERQRIQGLLPEVIRNILASPSPFIIEVFQNEAQAELGALAPEELVEQALRTLVEDQGGGRLRPTGSPPARPAAEELPPLFTTPNSLTIQGYSKAISKWNEVIIETANWLIDQGKQLPIGKAPGRTMVLVDRSSNGMHAPKQLRGGLYIDTGFSAPECVRRARWLLTQAGLPEEDLQVAWRAK